MPESSEPTPTPSPQSRSLRKLAAYGIVCTIVAITVNAGLYTLGRALDAALVIDPGVGAPNHVITVPDIAWKTAAALALGWIALVVAARYLPRWTTAAMVVGVAFAAASIPPVVMGAHDATTGTLLASMHTVTAIAYLAIWKSVRINRDQARSRYSVRHQTPSLP